MFLTVGRKCTHLFALYRIHPRFPLQPAAVIAQCETDPTLPSLSMALPRPQGRHCILLALKKLYSRPRHGRECPAARHPPCRLVSAEADALASPLLWLFWFCFAPVLLVVLSWFFEKIGVP